MPIFRSCRAMLMQSLFIIRLDLKTCILTGSVQNQVSQCKLQNRILATLKTVYAHEPPDTEHLQRQSALLR